MRHCVDLRQARMKLSMSVDVEGVQFVSRSMCPVGSFLTVSDGGDMEQSCEEFIRMGMHVICLVVRADEGGFVQRGSPVVDKCGLMKARLSRRSALVLM